MTELEKYEAINATTSLTELHEVLRTIDVVESRNTKVSGNTGTYWAERLSSIQDVFVIPGTAANDIRWTRLTRTYGIRQQAMMLAFYEKH